MHVTFCTITALAISISSQYGLNMLEGPGDSPRVETGARQGGGVGGGVIICVLQTQFLVCSMNLLSQIHRTEGGKDSLRVCVDLVLLRGYHN